MRTDRRSGGKRTETSKSKGNKNADEKEEEEDESSALMGLCGADLHTAASGRTLSMHPLLRDDPAHIRFNAFPLAVMGGAWVCQLPLMLFPYPQLLALTLAYALSLLIGCAALSYKYPSWTMDYYHVG